MSSLYSQYLSWNLVSSADIPISHLYAQLQAKGSLGWEVLGSSSFEGDSSQQRCVGIDDLMNLGLMNIRLKWNTCLQPEILINLYYMYRWYILILWIIHVVSWIVSFSDQFQIFGSIISCNSLCSKCLLKCNTRIFILLTIFTYFKSMMEQKVGSISTAFLKCKRKCILTFSRWCGVCLSV